MPTTQTIGDNGLDGRDGRRPGAPGTAGGNGESVVVAVTTPATLDQADTSRNIVNALGGQGGLGGFGADAAASGPGGNAGAGGAGGDARSTATNIGGVADTEAQANARGGDGGRAGLPGQGTPPGAGADGGNGGKAFAQALGQRLQGINPAPVAPDTAVGDAYAQGGAGGIGVGIGHKGGDGGIGTILGARAISDQNLVVQAITTSIGGAGGGALLGATGGTGGSATLTNATAITSNGGQANQFEQAFGGAGGGAIDGGQGGQGGNATATLTSDDRSNPTLSTRLFGGIVAAFAGGGGDSTDTTGSGVGGRSGIAKAVADITGTGNVNVVANATGANAGTSTNHAGVAGTNGNTASATATGLGATGFTSFVDARAQTSGNGGGAATGRGFTGGTGGDARGTRALATDTSGAVVDAFVLEQGGTGGNGFDGGAGGRGGIAQGASARATSTQAADVSATVIEAGGAGGDSNALGRGGNGTGARAVDAVSGETNGGALTLTQQAIAGQAGLSFGRAGQGASAVSTLTFDDTLNAHKSALITATVGALGSSGGDAPAGNGKGVGGNAGNATATATLIGANDVSLSVGAAAGRGGLGAVTGTSGIGQAIATAIGTGRVNANAAANGGFPGRFGGTNVGVHGTARATAIGANGTVSARSDSNPADKRLVSDAFGSASTTYTARSGLSDTSTASAATNFDAAVPTLDTTSQAVALAVGSPTALSLAPILAANGKLGAVFGAAGAAVFGAAELGGRYSPGGKGPEQISTQINISLDTFRLPAGEDLVVGLFGGQTFGAGLKDISVNLALNGSFTSYSFANGAAAQKFFSNNVIDLGAAANTQGSFAPTLIATLSFTATKPGSGLFGELLVGGAPGGSAGPVAAGTANPIALAALLAERPTPFALPTALSAPTSFSVLSPAVHAFRSALAAFAPPSGAGFDVLADAERHLSAHQQTLAAARA